MKVEFTDTATKKFLKLDSSVQKRIKQWRRKIEKLDNPKDTGKPLASNLTGLWRYRVDFYRLICCKKMINVWFCAEIFVSVM